ncbi:MAG: hypothetical protein J6X55_02045 [Victivallales bacterium]|nr:hypothetical protein [Victivallales bacterium]
MKQRIFIIFFLLCAVFFFAACRKKQQSAPEYDSRRSELLFASCEAMQEQDSGKTYEALKQMAEEFPTDKFATVAFRQEQKRQLIEKANSLLNDTSLNQLEQMLREIEVRGRVSPELLEYSQIKNALDQLRIFVSRMPWTSAESLRQNLRNLDVYEPILSQSQTFLSFRKQQDEILANLQKNEAHAAVMNTAATLEIALISGTGITKAHDACRKLAAAQPGNFLTRALAMKTAKDAKKLCEGVGRTSDDMKVCLEIAALDKWESLDKPTQNQILAFIGKNAPKSPSGHWLATKNKLTASAPMDFMAALSRDYPGCIPSQTIVREFMENNILSKAHYNAWCWRSPCPGVTELLARLKQVGQLHSATIK